MWLCLYVCGINRRGRTTQQSVTLCARVQDHWLSTPALISYSGHPVPDPSGEYGPGMCVLPPPLYTFLGMQTLRETRSNKRTADKRFDWRVNSANITRNHSHSISVGSTSSTRSTRDGIDS
ncbi:hypothetical protein CBL_09688 [Carabus blaptoides fortunei]